MIWINALTGLALIIGMFGLMMAISSYRQRQPRPYDPAKEAQSRNRHPSSNRAMKARCLVCNRSIAPTIAALKVHSALYHNGPEHENFPVDR